MTESTTNTTRASLLKRVALLAGGAVGLGVAAKPGGAATDLQPRSRRARTQTIVLYGRDWRLHRPGLAPGTRPTASDAAVPTGRIVDRRQRELGRFRAA